MLQSILEVTFLILLIPLGLCAYRGLPLRSLPWAASVVLLVLPLNIPSAFALEAALREELSSVDRLGLTLVDITIVWSYGHNFICTIIYLLLVMLICSDLIFVLTKTDSAVRRGPVHHLLEMRRTSTGWGIILTSLAFLRPLAAIGFWVA